MEKTTEKKGKPTLPPGEKKVTITFRTHPKKKLYYQDKADLLFGGNLTRFIEYQLEDQQNNKISVQSSEEKVDRSQFYALIRELNKIGNNLNQLTRKANMGHFINTSLEKNLAEMREKNQKLFALLVDKLEENIPNT